MTILLRIFAMSMLATMLVSGCGKKGEVLRRISLIADGEKSAFAQTQAAFPVVYDSTSMGVFVRSINGFSSTNTAYWLYFINSKPVPKAANEFVPASGDTIEWRLISGY